MARFLGIDNYGLYVIAFIIPRIIISFGSFGIGPAIVYHYNKNKLHISSIVITFSLFGLILGSLYCFLGYILMDLLQTYFFHQKVSTDILLVTLYLIPILLVQKYIRQTLRATYRIKEFAFILNIISSITRLILTIFILVILNLGLVGIVWVPIVTQLFTTLIIFFILRKDILSGINNGFIFLNMDVFKNIFVFGLKGHLGGTMQKANEHISTLIMTVMLSPASVGFYSLAFKAVNGFSVIKDAIGTVLSPKVAQSNLIEIRSYFPQLLRILLVVNLVIGAAIIVVLPIIIPFFYGPTFNPVIPIAIIITPGFILLPIALMVMVMFSQTGRPLVKGVIRVFGLVVNIIFLFFLISPYGYIGAAVASTASSVAMFIIAVIMGSRYLNISIRDLLVITKSDIYKILKNIKIVLSGVKSNLSKTR